MDVLMIVFDSVINDLGTLNCVIIKTPLTFLPSI
jgi:hypothetical protein